MTDPAELIQPRVRKFPCSSCGADVRWDPGASVLVCPHCGTRREIPQSAAEIRERPIEEAFRNRKDLGWGMERKAVRCQRCAATTTFEAGQSAGSCAFCGTSAVVEATLDGNMLRPEGVLPFRIPREKSVASFRSWVQGLWFRPNDLKAKSTITNMRGVYVPFWMFDAATHSFWSAEAGHYYYVTVDGVVNGKRVTKQERRTRWEHAEGQLERFFDDLPIPASKGLDHSLTEEIEPFPTEEIVAYDPHFLSGFLAEEYAIDVEPSLEAARERMRRVIEAECASRVPGDTHRNLQVQTSTSAVAYKNALLPVWIAAYDYSGKPYRFLVNGVTGAVSGEAPYSWLKISVALFCCLLVFLFFWANSNQ